MKLLHHMGIPAAAYMDIILITPISTDQYAHQDDLAIMDDDPQQHKRNLLAVLRRRFSKKSGVSARIGGALLWAATP